MTERKNFEAKSVHTQFFTDDDTKLPTVTTDQNHCADRFHSSVSELWALKPDSDTARSAEHAAY